MTLADPTAAASPDRRPAARFAYVGSYGRGPQAATGTTSAGGISIFTVAPETGALSHRRTAPSDNPSFLALDPTRPVLYAVNEVEDFAGRSSGAVEAYAIDEASGDLTLLNRQDSGGAGPAHLAVDPEGRFLVVANYVGATFAVLPIMEDGRLKPASAVLRQRGSGPHPERQRAPHPHGVAFDPSGRFVALADLGTDQVRICRVPAGATGLLPVSEASTAPGAGPRHVLFHPAGRLLYAINELDLTVTLFAFEPKNGQIGAIAQTVPTLPPSAVGQATTAELALHPSGRFLYGSNRGGPGTKTPLADSLAVFAVDPGNGHLTPAGHAADGLAVPRHFALDPTGAWLYACNQATGSIAQFAVDPERGELRPTGPETAVATPVCLVFA